MNTLLCQQLVPVNLTRGIGVILESLIRWYDAPYAILQKSPKSKH